MASPTCDVKIVAILRCSLWRGDRYAEEKLAGQANDGFSADGTKASADYQPHETKRPHKRQKSERIGPSRGNRGRRRERGGEQSSEARSCHACRVGRMAAQDSQEQAALLRLP